MGTKREQAMAIVDAWDMTLHSPTHHEDARNNLIDRITAALEDGVCNWTANSDGVYQTDCDNAWQFEAGTAADNKMVYCGFCGKRIHERQET